MASYLPKLSEARVPAIDDNGVRSESFTPSKGPRRDKNPGDTMTIVSPLFFGRLKHVLTQENFFGWCRGSYRD